MAASTILRTRARRLFVTITAAFLAAALAVVVWNATASASTLYRANTLICDRLGADQGYADGQLYNPTSKTHGYRVTVVYDWFGERAGSASEGFRDGAHRTFVWINETRGPLEIDGRRVEGSGGLSCHRTVTVLW